MPTEPIKEIKEAYYTHEAVMLFILIMYHKLIT